jgi:hypothetical protein
MAARYRYIAVEGPIGAGKTSLARRLAERLDAEAVLEQPGENPFLARFYQDMTRYDADPALFLLLASVTELPAIRPVRPAGGCRFLMTRTRFLRAPRFQPTMVLYQKIYDANRPQSPVPDVVITCRRGRSR